MTVKAILATKGSDVITIGPAYSMHIASKKLRENKIGALVVCEGDRRILGIISERDIVGTISMHGTAAIAKPVNDVMTRDVKTCTPSETVASLMERMTDGKFRHLPVVENGKTVGIVSIGDVVKRHLENVEREQEALRKYVQTA